MSNDISSISEESTPFSGEELKLDFTLYCDASQQRNGNSFFSQEKLVHHSEWFEQQFVYDFIIE